MTNLDAWVALWGVFQPLLIQWIAGKEHGRIKWFVIITLSLISGVIFYAVQSGGITPDSSLADMLGMVAKVLVISLGTWGALWKKIFPNKDNPLTAEVEGQKETLYTVPVGFDGVWEDIDVYAINGYEATQKAIKKLKKRLEML